MVERQMLPWQTKSILIRFSPTLSLRFIPYLPDSLFITTSKIFIFTPVLRNNQNTFCVINCVIFNRHNTCYFNRRRQPFRPYPLPALRTPYHQQEQLSPGHDSENKNHSSYSVPLRRTLSLCPRLPSEYTHQA